MSLTYLLTTEQLLTENDLTWERDSGSIHPVNVVRDLGVMLKRELSIKQHVTKVASSCFYHLQRLKQIRRLVGQEVMVQLVSAFILSRFDYCNAVLAELPCATLDPPQRVQNTAARLVLNLRLCDHVTPALKQLHCLVNAASAFLAQQHGTHYHLICGQ